MHPRSSFKAFLEVVKQRSLPWEDVEMDAIHSLQLILRGSLQDEVVEDSKIIVNVPSIDDKIERVDELRIITNEMVRLIETAAVPIMAVDASGSINGWNSKVAELTGLAVEQSIGTPFVDLVDENSVDVVKNMLSMTLLALEAVMTQVMIPIKEHQVQLIHDLPDEVSSMSLYGDRLRLQQVLSDFLTNALIFTPAYEGSSIVFRVIPRKQRIGKKIHIVHLEFRITHPAPRIPEKLIHEMFYHSQGASREGLGLYMCQKLVKIMNGTVQSLLPGKWSQKIELGRKAADMLFGMEPQNDANYILLANMYAYGDKGEYAARVRKLMREAEVKKEAGSSWVTMKDGVHVFVAGGKSHP
ncbi:hypothetical protein LWI29_017426 [Acer saccharum]|uniref:PAS domain-containing protein n=1 Tax=Acer saccharum TaxID=4024 RepID=A0AA39VT63_ACESA|nr:hypothetical protein LWI29_017426 [Acer saccharum]